MEIVKKTQEQEEAGDNPAGKTLMAVGGDILNFGLPGIIAYYAAEWMTDALKANVADKRMAYVGAGLIKVGIGGAVFWAGAKKVEKPWGKKATMGLGTGLVISAGTDFVDAATSA